MNVDVNLDDEIVASYCKQYPDRLIGFTSIHPDRYQPHRKLERAVREFGMKGVKLYPHSGFYPNDERLNLVFQKCIEFDIPVMVHTGIKAVSWQSLKFNRPMYVDDLATNFPELKIIMCHGGYPWEEEFIVVAYSNPNVWVDITFLDYIEKIYKKPGLVENTISRLIDLIGPKRILWGSEGPYMNLPLFGSHGPEYYAYSQNFLVKRFNFLSEEDKKNILGENARKLLKIK
jgi:predicted TIM-barrel fold metal-dependent hydrolase